MEYLSDSTLIHYIRAGGALREQALQELAQDKFTFQKVNEYVLTNGNRKEARRIWAEGILHLARLIELHTYPPTTASNHQGEENNAVWQPTLKEKLEAICKKRWEDTRRLTDDELVRYIQTGGESEKRAMKELTQDKATFQKVEKLVLQKRGTAGDAEETWTDGLLILNDKIKKNEYRGNGTIRNFLKGICRNHWQNQFRKKKNKNFDHELPESPDSFDLLQHWKEREDYEQLLQAVQELIGKDCQELLALHAEGYKMKEIAVILNLIDVYADAEAIENAVEIIKARIYKCRKKLRAQLSSNSIFGTAKKIKNEF